MIDCSHTEDACSNLVLSYYLKKSITLHLGTCSFLKISRDKEKAGNFEN